MSLLTSQRFALSCGLGLKWSEKKGRNLKKKFFDILRHVEGFLWKIFILILSTMSLKNMNKLLHWDKEYNHENHISELNVKKIIAVVDATFVGWKSEKSFRLVRDSNPCFLWYGSGSSPNGHSRKLTALRTATFTKPRFTLLPYKLCIFTFP